MGATLSQQERLERLVQMGGPFHLDKSDLLGRTVGYESVLNDVGREMPTLADPRGPQLFWQITSGLAHGQRWASLNFLDRVNVASDTEAGLATLKFTTSDHHLQLSVMIAAELTREAFRLFDRHRLNWKTA